MTPPARGAQFAVAGRSDVLTVEVCELAVVDDLTGITHYLVRTPHGARWTLVQRNGAWHGTPLPADPDAPTR